MEKGEASEYIQGVRDYRKELATPLHDPTTPPEEKTKALGEIQAWNELNHADPDYRQAMRIVAEIRSQREINPPQPEIVEKKAEFPTDPEERYAAILSSLANNAAKQITFLSIPSVPGTIITPWKLHLAFLNNSGQVWRTSKYLQKDHATRSLIPIGMVAEEVGFGNGIQEQTMGFTQTKAGREYGGPVSKFFLKYATDHNTSLEKILGKTNSKTDSRTPYTKVQILEYLLHRKDKDNIRIKDIQEYWEHSSAQNISNALNSLQDEGFVMFDSVKPEQTQGRYTYALNPEFKGEAKSRLPTNLAHVMDAIKTFQESGVTEFEADLIVKEIQKANPNIKRRMIQLVLFDLARGGGNYLVRTKYKGNEVRSKVIILPEGEKFVREVLAPLRVALTDTSEGKELRQQWKNIPWEEYAANALIIHQKNSKNANKTSPEVTKGEIIEIVSDNPGIRYAEIRNKLKERGLPYKVSSSSLKPLMDNGYIRVEKQGHATRWYPAKENVQDESTA